MSESLRMDPADVPEAPAELIDLFRDAETRAYGADVDADYGVIFARALGVVLAENERQVREKVLAEQANWLPEILHVVYGFAMREHEGTPQLVPAHAEEALRHVPGAVLDAARVARGETS